MKYFCSFRDILFTPIYYYFRSNYTLLFHRAAREERRWHVFWYRSSPSLDCLRCNFFNTFTGECIKSIASGRTVTSHKAHSKVPNSTCSFSFYVPEKVLKKSFSAAPTSSSSFQVRHGHSPAGQRWGKLHPCHRSTTRSLTSNNLGLFITKFTLSKKELKTRTISSCLTRSSCFFSYLEDKVLPVKKKKTRQQFRLKDVSVLAVTEQPASNVPCPNK